jgi:acyl carrier protein
MSASAIELETWMVEKIAKALNVPWDSIDTTAPFTQHGLDSMVSSRITGELQEKLGRELDAAVFWQYPSIASLSAYLAKS